MKQMKLIITMVLLMVSLLVQAQRPKVYLNPIQSQVTLNDNNRNRINTVINLGLTRAKTIEITSGDKLMQNSVLAAEGYQMVINLKVTEANHKQDTELFSDKKKETYTASLKVDVEMLNVADGTRIAESTINGSASDKDIQFAYYQSARNFDEQALDFIDDALPVVGEITDVDKSDKKGLEARQVRINIGSGAGIRQDQMFGVYKIVDDVEKEIGLARCEQVLSTNESLVKVLESKDGEKAVYEALQNMDGSYRLIVRSRSKKYLKKLTESFGDIFTAKKERGFYYEPNLERKAKLRVGVKSCVSANSNVNGSVLEAIANAAVQGFSKVTTIEFIPQYFYTLEQARQSGLDGLIDISCDNVLNTTEQMKDGKTRYKTEIYVTMAGINVHTGAWIEMRESDKAAYSTENQQKAQVQAVSFLVDNFKKFAEDVFPVAGFVINEAKVDSKGHTDEAYINIGSQVGVRENMMFDIYVQYKEGGYESRVLLATGKVKGKPTKDSALIKRAAIKDGKYEQLHQLLQNNTGETEIIVISRASIDRVDSVLNNIGGFLKIL